MPAWVPVVVTIVIAVVTIIVNAIVSVTVKFSPDRETASADLKRIGSTAIRWGFNMLLVASVAWSVLTPAPLTRWSVFQIALGVGVLIFLLINHNMLQLMGVIDRIVRIQERQVQAALAKDTGRSST